MNGRVNIEQPNTDVLFNLKDKIAVKSSDYRDALTGTIVKTNLSNAYFSKENIDIIQNGIRAGVYNLSKGSYIIAPQSVDNIKIIMRSVYLDNCSNLPNNITEQIQELNDIVLDYCIPKVYGEAKGYLKYLEDASTLVVPIDRPVQVDVNDKTLSEKFWF